MIERKSCILWEVNVVHSFVASDWTESEGCYFCTPARLLVCYYLGNTMLVEGLILCWCAFSSSWTSILPDSPAQPHQKYIRGQVLASDWKWHSQAVNFSWRSRQLQISRNSAPATKFCIMLWITAIFANLGFLVLSAWRRQWHDSLPAVCCEVLLCMSCVWRCQVEHTERNSRVYLRKHSVVWGWYTSKNWTAYIPVKCWWSESNSSSGRPAAVGLQHSSSKTVCHCTGMFECAMYALLQNDLSVCILTCREMTLGTRT